MTSIEPVGQAAFARRLMAATGGVFLLTGGVALTLTRLFPRAAGAEGLFPPAFWLSSICLAAGSLSTHRALTAVRLERQEAFRRALLWALVWGMAFVSIQSYGMWWFTQTSPGRATSANVQGFVFVFTFMHALHFTVALFCLVFVTLKAFAGRYDHEYYWGVTVCTVFWHVLGVVWIAILGVYLIVVGGGLS